MSLTAKKCGVFRCINKRELDFRVILQTDNRSWKRGRYVGEGKSRER